MTELEQLKAEIEALRLEKQKLLLESEISNLKQEKNTKVMWINMTQDKAAKLWELATKSLDWLLSITTAFIERMAVNLADVQTARLKAKEEQIGKNQWNLRSNR